VSVEAFLPEDDLTDDRLRRAQVEGRLHSSFESLPRLAPQWSQAFAAAIEGDPTEFDALFRSSWDARERRKGEYQKYLQSGSWYDKRQQVLARAGRICERCGAANQVLQVHHLSYAANRGDEALEDLIAVCGACHAELHR
jgi:hypothetical protein